MRSLKPHLQRRFSRKLIQQYISHNMKGLELGTGEQTIAPLKQTLLSDAYKDHAGAKSLATVYFPAEAIPYPDHSFDFLLNEHVLEHVPNPLKALKEWARVLKPEGILFLFLPHPQRTFDQHRAVTSLAHLQEDFEKNATSAEDHHWKEWNEQVIQKGLAKHYADYSKEEMLNQNMIHRHVFTPSSIQEILIYSGFEIKEVIPTVTDRTDTFCVIAKRSGAGKH